MNHASVQRTNVPCSKGGCGRGKNGKEQDCGKQNSERRCERRHIDWKARKMSVMRRSSLSDGLYGPRNLQREDGRHKGSETDLMFHHTKDVRVFKQLLEI